MRGNVKLDRLPVKILHPHASLPQFHTDGAAGLDLRAAIDAPVTLRPMERALIPAGLAIAIPRGHAGMVYPRSGPALKHGITLINAVGVIDSDYRGEIKCPLINLGEEPYTIRPGERFAQLVLHRFEAFAPERVETLDETERGLDGFGSTGID